MAFLALAASACVTVNVNLPESAVQKATDDYVHDLYRSRDKPAAKSPVPSASAAPMPAASPTTRTSRAVDFSLFNSAWADSTDGTLRVTSAKTEEIRTRLRSRLDDVLNDKRQGILGEGADGLLVVKDPSKVPSKLLLKKVEKLVAEDNQDRNELYEEIQKSNGLDSSRLPGIRKSFARSFATESPAGTWVQDVDGKWSQKK